MIREATPQRSLAVGRVLLLGCLVSTWACHDAPPAVKEPSGASQQEAQIPAEPSQGDPCEGATVCTRLGRCSHINGLCQALRDTDCANSGNCRRYGECKAVGGICLPATQAQCEKSEICRVHGQCTYIKRQCSEGSSGPTGLCLRDICVVTADASCAASERCASHGECRALNLERARSRSLKGQQRWPVLACGVPAKQNSDCLRPRGSEGKIPCEERGQCSVGVEGNCEACGDSCRQTEICRTQGLCYAVAGRCHNASRKEAEDTFPCRPPEIAP